MESGVGGVTNVDGQREDKGGIDLQDMISGQGWQGVGMEYKRPSPLQRPL